MARKPQQSSRATQRAQRPTSPATPTFKRIRLPENWRIVTSRAMQPRKSDTRSAPRREVPEIRLSGEWLERVGFPKGARFLMSTNSDFREIVLQAEFERARKPRRRG